MKKLLIIPAMLALSCGVASAGVIFIPVPTPAPAPAPSGPFGGNWTANATVSQSVGNIRNSYVRQDAQVVQNAPQFGGGFYSGHYRNSFGGNWSAGATVNQSVSGAYASRVYQNTSVIQNTPTFANGAP